MFTAVLAAIVAALAPCVLGRELAQTSQTPSLDNCTDTPQTMPEVLQAIAVSVLDQTPRVICFETPPDECAAAHCSAPLISVLAGPPPPASP